MWAAINEEAFRRRLLQLETLTNGVPADVQVYEFRPLSQNENNPQSSSEEDPSPTSTQTCTIPLQTEQQLVDDIAYIAATREGAQSVAATYLTQREQHPSQLEISIAAGDISGGTAPCCLTAIFDVLRQHSRSLLFSLPGSSHPSSSPVDEILHFLVQAHAQKLLGRLRSTHWTKPAYLSQTHKKPLHADLDNAIHRVQHIYPRRAQRAQRGKVEAALTALKSELVAFETAQSTAEELGGHLERVVRVVFSFCMDPSVREFATALTLQGQTAQVAAAVKCLRQLEKIGAYRRIACDLVRLATRYSFLFDDVRFVWLGGFDAVPTTVAYEDWADSMSVHAEVVCCVERDLAAQAQAQIDVDDSAAEGAGVKAAFSWRLSPATRPLGTSKYLCFLCFHFLRLHAASITHPRPRPQRAGHTNEKRCRGESRYRPGNEDRESDGRCRDINGRCFAHPRATHGRLYDQWTVPDLAEFGEELRERYIWILRELDRLVAAEIEALHGKKTWRAEPMTSRQDLLAGFHRSDEAYGNS
jgi:hypothetical protein